MMYVFIVTKFSVVVVVYDIQLVLSLLTFVHTYMLMTMVPLFLLASYL